MGWIYFQRRFECRVGDAARRQVSCEKCSEKYDYDVARTVTGTGVSPYGLNDAGAIRRAERSARRRLEKIMRSAVDPVRCPGCGWLQAEMVNEMRRWRYSSVRAIAICVLLFALFVAMGWGDVVACDR